MPSISNLLDAFFHISSRACNWPLATFFGCTMVSMVSMVSRFHGANTPISMLLFTVLRCDSIAFVLANFTSITNSRAKKSISRSRSECKGNKNNKNNNANTSASGFSKCTPFFTLRYRRFIEETRAVTLCRWSQFFFFFPFHPFFLNANVLIRFVLFREMNEGGYHIKPSIFRQKISFVSKSIRKK